MIVSSTEVQNNFGKYLILAAQEDVVITRNGTAIATLTAVKRNDSASGSKLPEAVKESVEPYGPYRYTGIGGYGGRAGSYEEFLELTRDNEKDRYEYIDGEIYLLASPRTAHQHTLGELFSIFHGWFKGKPCQPFIAPYDITLTRTGEDINVVQPDLMVICDLDDHLNNRDYYMGVPTLVAEILSESTRMKDTLKKLDLYTWCGVKEYWVVNPSDREITVHRLDKGIILRSLTFSEDDIAQSFRFPGLSVPLADIFR